MLARFAVSLPIVAFLLLVTTKLKAQQWTNLSLPDSSATSAAPTNAIHRSGPNLYAAFCFSVFRYVDNGWVELGGPANFLKTTDTIKAVCTDKWGNVYAGGWFKNNGQLALAKWNGTQWSFIPLPASLGIESHVRQMVGDTAGNIYLLATALVSGNRQDVVFRYNGSSFTAMHATATSLRFEPELGQLHRTKNNQLVISGKVWRYNPNQTPGPAGVWVWASNTWGPVHGYPNPMLTQMGNISGIASDSSSQLYVCGVGGSIQVARNTGSAWAQLGTGATQISNDAYALHAIAVDANSHVFVGGETYVSLGNDSRLVLFHWNGMQWSKTPIVSDSFRVVANQYFSRNESIQAISFSPANALLCGGNVKTFQSLNPISSSRYCIKELVGNRFVKKGSGEKQLGKYDSFWDISFGANDSLLLLSTVQTDIDESVAFTGTASPWKVIGDSGLQAYFLSNILRNKNNGEIYVSGIMTDTSYSGVAMWKNGRWTSLGNASSVWRTSNPYPGIQTDQLALDKDGKLYVTGRVIDDSGYYYIPVWNGNQWSSLGSGVNRLRATKPPFAIYVAKDNQVYVAHDAYSSAVGTGYLKKWTGQQWVDITPNFPLHQFQYAQSVTGITEDSAGNIIIWGRYANATGNPIVLKYSNGQWQELRSASSSLNANEIIYTVAVDKWGNIYAAGEFTDANGKTYVARFDGTTWRSYGGQQNGFDGTGPLYPLKIDSQNRLYVTGLLLNTRGLIEIKRIQLTGFALPLPAATLAGTFTTHPQLSWRFQGATADIATAQLQRSTNGVDFHNIATVTTVQQFTDRDAPANAPRLYYRLLLTSKTGEAQHSNIIALSPVAKPLFISVSPNPAKDQVVLSSKEPLRNATVQLVNAQGQVMQQWQGLSGQRAVLPLTAGKGQYQLVVRQAGGHEVLPLQVGE